MNTPHWASGERPKCHGDSVIAVITRPHSGGAPRPFGTRRSCLGSAPSQADSRVGCTSSPGSLRPSTRAPAHAPCSKTDSPRRLDASCTARRLFPVRCTFLARGNDHPVAYERQSAGMLAVGIVASAAPRPAKLERELRQFRRINQGLTNGPCWPAA